MAAEKRVKKLRCIQRSADRHWVGDGFPVRTLFAYPNLGPVLSPFLLLDYAGPREFAPTSERLGVGEHPHRGFETVTIVYAGEVEHRDSSGGGGRIGPGDVQWMTAASGLVHEEFHGRAFARTGGLFEMVQLWVNLPAKDKLTKPRYQDIQADGIPEVELGPGARARVLVGTVNGVKGPVMEVATDPLYFDLHLEPNASYTATLPEGHNAFAYVYDGDAKIGGAGTGVQRSELAMLTQGESLPVTAGAQGARLIVVAGRPLEEPVARYGPFVMNTADEIRQAFADYQAGRL